DRSEAQKADGRGPKPPPTLLYPLPACCLHFARLPHMQNGGFSRGFRRLGGIPGVHLTPRNGHYLKRTSVFQAISAFRCEKVAQSAAVAQVRQIRERGLGWSGPPSFSAGRFTDRFDGVDTALSPAARFSVREKTPPPGRWRPAHVARTE